MSGDYKLKINGPLEETTPGGALRENKSGKGRYDLIPPAALRRVALHYEEGGKRHGDNNWQKGMPFHKALDPALRHLQQYLEGDRSEDHLAACVWNCFAIMFYEEQIKKGLLNFTLMDIGNSTPAPTHELPSRQGNPPASPGAEGLLEELRLRYPNDFKPAESYSYPTTPAEVERDPPLYTPRYTGPGRVRNDVRVSVTSELSRTPNGDPPIECRVWCAAHGIHPKRPTMDTGDRCNA